MARKVVYAENFDRLVKLGILTPDGKLTFKEYMKIENEPYMPLSLDNLGNNTFSMAHNFEQNGDLIPDPDMEIRIIPELKMVEALAIQHSTGYYRRVYIDENKYYPREKKEQNSFLNMWTKNLLDQGFAEGKITKKR